MPQYYRLRFDVPAADRKRVVGRLQALRAQLDAEIPDKDAEQHLLLATWNVRDFGKQNRRGYGRRLPETHFYIAEIISRFDFVAVQEVNDLPEWKQVMAILGPDWDFICSDVTDTALGGNGERLLYVYDKRKVWFQNIAGEIVLPARMLISPVTAEIDGDRLHAGKQFRRTPFLTAFQSGWFGFDICTVHIYYGADTGAQLEERIQEIDRIAKYFGKRAAKAKKGNRALILLGDFNIVHPDHETMKSLADNGFVVPKALNRPSNLGGDKYYDQIAFQADGKVIEFIDTPAAKPKNANAGIFEIFASVFRDEHFDDYRDAAKKTSNGKAKAGAELRKYYGDWKTYQLSDHKPMWVRIRSNDSAAYLDTIA